MINGKRIVAPPIASSKGLVCRLLIHLETKINARKRKAFDVGSQCCSRCCDVQLVGLEFWRTGAFRFRVLIFEPLMAYFLSFFFKVIPSTRAAQSCRAFASHRSTRRPGTSRCYAALGYAPSLSCVRPQPSCCSRPETTCTTHHHPGSEPAQSTIALL